MDFVSLSDISDVKRQTADSTRVKKFEVYQCTSYKNHGPFSTVLKKYFQHLKFHLPSNLKNE